MFNMGGVGKEGQQKTSTEKTTESKKTKIPSTTKISRTSMDQEMLIKRQKISMNSKTIQYVRPTLDLFAILPSSPMILAKDVLVVVGEGSNREQVMLMKERKKERRC